MSQSETRCGIHPESPAAMLCDRCDTPICELCTTAFGYQTVCRPCRKKLAGRSAVKRAMIGLLLLGAIGAGVAGGVYYVAAYVPPFDHGKHGPEIRKLQARMETEPCDRRAIIELGEVLNRAGDYRGALTSSKTFFEKCGEYPRLRWVTYTAHKYLSEWAPAAADATVLIEDTPDDKDYRWWRAVALEKGGELEGAVRDYRQAIALVPRLDGIPFNLANVLEKQKKPCEAALPLEQFLHYHPEVNNAVSIRGRIERLRLEGDCGAVSGDTATLRFDPAERIILATVKLGSGVEAKVLVDTGASLVAITPAIAADLALNLVEAPKMRIHTAGGVEEGRHVWLPEISLGGLTARRVEGVVMETLPEDLDGILGLSFLSRFDMQTDRSKGVLILSVAGSPAEKPSKERSAPRSPPIRKRHQGAKTR